jgi:RNA polymerase sigma-70 factor (ECF subfamily)
MTSDHFDNESELVLNLSKGSILAFNQLFRKYGGLLYRFAYGYFKSVSDSEELVQDVFTKIWEKRSDLKSDLSFKSYLFTIAFNDIKKFFRTKARQKEYLNEFLFEDIDHGTSQTISYNSLLDHVKELVDQLPEKRKEIFLRSRFEGQSIKEISKELNITHKTVENQISLALKSLRKNLTKEDIGFCLFFFLFLS